VTWNLVQSLLLVATNSLILNVANPILSFSTLINLSGTWIIAILTPLALSRMVSPSFRSGRCQMLLGHVSIRRLRPSWKPILLLKLLRSNVYYSRRCPHNTSYTSKHSLSTWLRTYTVPNIITACVVILLWCWSKFFWSIETIIRVPCHFD